MFLFLLIYNLPRTDEIAFVDQNDFKLDVLSDTKLLVTACSGFIIDLLKNNNIRSKFLDNVEKQRVCSNVKKNGHYYSN